MLHPPLLNQRSQPLVIRKGCFYKRKPNLPISGLATGRGQGGRVPPLTAKKIAKNRDKEGENQERGGRKKKEKSGRFFFFTFPLLTDWASYATAPNPNKTSNLIIFNRDEMISSSEARFWNETPLHIPITSSCDDFLNYPCHFLGARPGSTRTLSTPDSNVTFDMKHRATPFIIHTPPVEDFGKVYRRGVWIYSFLCDF